MRPTRSFRIDRDLASEVSKAAVTATDQFNLDATYKLMCSSVENELCYLFDAVTIKSAPSPHLVPSPRHCGYHQYYRVVQRRLLRPLSGGLGAVAVVVVVSWHWYRF